MTSLVVGICVPDDIAKQHFTHRNLRHDHLQLERKEAQIQNSVTFQDKNECLQANFYKGFRY